MRKWNHAGRNLVLFVAKIPAGTIESIRAYNKTHKRRLHVALAYDSRKPKVKKEIARHKKDVDIFIGCDFTSNSKLRKALLPYEDRILAVTCRSEANMHLYRKLVPHLPYLRTPTSESIEWSTDKIEMRKRFYAYDKRITPKFAIVDSSGQAAIEKINRRVGFPLVVKPAGLAQSMLVSICYHEEELETVLRKTLRKVRKSYRERGSDEEPRILVEEFMEGEMYSVDAYVTSRGKVHLCPVVHIKTGRNVGFDDFFGYQQITPSGLSKTSIKQAEEVTEKAIHALGLRSSSAHVELMKTEKGWKIVEVGARIGGFRHTLYRLAYGIDHAMNDIRIHIQEKPLVTKREKGHAVAMKFYAKKEGRITKLQGLKKAQKLESFVELRQRKKIGDRCKFAKHGGECVFDIKLFNKKRPRLLADIRRLEQMIHIETA